MSSQMSNPFSTGGGGNRFEQMVGAYYLVSLLAEDIPRGLSQGIIQSVRFQQRYTGSIIDDIVITGDNTSGGQYTLSLQLKHDISFTASSELLKQVLADCWRDFSKSTFDRERNRIGIGFGAQPSATVNHLHRALDWAKTASSSEQYFQKLNMPNVGSDDMRHYVSGVIRPILDSAASNPLTDLQVYQFLRSLVVIHFDLLGEAGRDASFIWNRLLDQLDGRNEAEARNLVTRLTDIVAKYNTHAAGLDRAHLISLIGADFYLKGRQSCQRDLDLLRKHTNLVLDQIRTEIGQTVILPKIQQVNELSEIIQQTETRIITIVGEPGSGKSGLMKLVAEHARQENEIIATAVDRLNFSGLGTFLAGVNHDLVTLLGAMSSGAFRCLFVDQLERILADDDKLRTLGDILHLVEQFNQRLISVGGHNGSCWRIIFTCRKREFHDIQYQTDLFRNIDSNQHQVYELQQLSESEFQSVLDQLPQMAYLRNHVPTQALLKIPFYLNLLAKHTTAFSGELPTLLTEAWFMRLFWENIVRKGNDKYLREKLLVALAQYRLQRGIAFAPPIQLDPVTLQNVLGAMISEQILIEEPAGVRFAHDVFDDWAMVRLIEIEQDDLARLSQQAINSYSLLRPIELWVLYLIEVQNLPDKAINLANTEGIPTGWRETLLQAFLRAINLSGSLQRVPHVLFNKNSKIFADLLRILRTDCTLPSATMLDLLYGLPDSARKAEILSYTRDPIIDLWEPVIQFVVNRQSEIPVNALSELAEVCRMWLGARHAPLRADVALICYTYLTSPFDEQLDEVMDGDNDAIVTYYSDIGWLSEQTRRTLTQALLSAADCTPDKVISFVRDSVVGQRRNEISDLLLNDGNWIQMAIHLPDLLIEAAEQILCWKPLPQEEAEQRSRNSLSRIPMPITEEEQIRERCSHSDMGINNDHNWAPATYDTGPFYFLLRANSNYGLKLIHIVVNHATNHWRRCQELSDYFHSTPLPQQIQLSQKVIELWGNPQVYTWSRLGSRSNAVDCALRALEKWLDEQIENDAEPTQLFERILEETNSLSVACVLITISLKHMDKCMGAVLSLLQCSAIWVTDTQRLVHESSTEFLVRMWGATVNKARLKAMVEWETAPHRRFSTMELARLILLRGTENDKHLLSRAMANFPTNLPFFSEEESQNTTLVEQRRKQFETIAAWSDPNTWKIEVVGESDAGLIVSIEPQQMVEVRDKYAEDMQRQASIAQMWSIQQWGLKLRDDGNVGKAFTLAEAINIVEEFEKLAESLSNIDRYYPIYLLQGVVATVAGLIIHHYEWLQATGRLDWAYEMILELASFQDPTVDPEVGPSIYPMGTSCSVAVALPAFLKQKSQDVQLREAICRLISHPHYEVRSILFKSMQDFWQIDADFTLKCLFLGLHETLLVHEARKTHRLRSDDLTRLTWHELIPSLAEHPPRNIDYYGLVPTLYLMTFNQQDQQSIHFTKTLDLINDLLKLTIRAYQYTRDTKHDNYVFSVLLHWTPPFSDILADWMLRLSEDVADSHILNPILEQWPLTAELLHEFMLSAAFACTYDQTLKSRFVILWNHIAKIVLPSLRSDNGRHFFDRGVKDTVTTMLFVDERLSVELARKLPILHFAQLFEEWVLAVGHTRDGYRILIRFCRDIVFGNMLTHGLRWLHQAWQHNANKDSIIGDERIAPALALLLLKTWDAFEETLQNDEANLRLYSELIDELAMRGQQIAVELRRKLR